jgi:hypothetical protein
MLAILGADQDLHELSVNNALPERDNRRAYLDHFLPGEVRPIGAEDQRALAEFAASIGASVPEPELLSLLLPLIPLAYRRRRMAIR